MPRNCVVFGCTNNEVNCKDRVPKIEFYRFSTNPLKQSQRDIWINFVKRQDINGKPWKPSDTSRICSVHFIRSKKSDDPLSPSFNPSIHPVNSTNFSNDTSERYERAKKRKNKQIFPTVVKPVDELQNRIEDETNVTFYMEIDIPRTSEISTQTEEQNGVWNLDEFSCDFESQFTKSCQTSHTFHPSVTEKHKFADTGCGSDEPSFGFYGFESAKYNEKIVHDLTGVSLNVFSLLLSLLPKKCNVVQTHMTLENRLLLTLIKLKSDLSYVFLSCIFGISVPTCSKIFTSIISYLEISTKDWIIWPSKSSIQTTMPNAFKKDYPNCRVIIDCTEIKTEQPPGVDRQMKMYSQYKGTWTVKYLVGITPCGFFSFISKAYGGRASDPFITNNCGILEKLEYGDLVLADKGFPNLEIKNGTIVVMPPFANKNQKQFSSQQMNDTYKVASVRIHVERAIQRIKIYKILTNRLSIDLLPYIDSIFHVCTILANLQTPIIKQGVISDE